METNTKDRWAIFSKKIIDRQAELLSDARQTLNTLLVNVEYDYLAVERAWYAIHEKIEPLTTKVETVFDDVIFSDENIPSVLQKQLRQNKQLLLATLLEKLLIAEAHLMGELSERYFAYVTKLEKSQKHICTQCSAPIELRLDVFRAQYISCTFCNTTNTLNPTTLFIQASWNPLNHRARYELIEQYKQHVHMYAHNLYQTTKVVSFETYKKQHEQYLRDWHTKRASVSTELEETLEADIIKSLHKIDNQKL